MLDLSIPAYNRCPGITGCKLSLPSELMSIGSRVVLRVCSWLFNVESLVPGVGLAVGVVVKSFPASNSVLVNIDIDSELGLA